MWVLNSPVRVWPYALAALISANFPAIIVVSNWSSGQSSGQVIHSRTTTAGVVLAASWPGAVLITSRRCPRVIVSDNPWTIPAKLERSTRLRRVVMLALVRLRQIMTGRRAPFAGHQFPAVHTLENYRPAARTPRRQEHKHPLQHFARISPRLRHTVPFSMARARRLFFISAFV